MKGEEFMRDEKFEFEVSAAGRVNLIGEHIDYCGGKVLPAALPMRNVVSVRRNGTNAIRLSWTDLPDRISLEIGKFEQYRDCKHAKYQAGCAHFWQEAGHKLVGCDLRFNCNIPFGSGLSSSAAIEVSTIAALAVAAGEPFDKKEVALVAQRAEHEFAGVKCGIMDQYVSACGKKGNAVLLDCKRIEHTYVPVLLGDCALVIANSNKPHSLVESRYNERRAETEEALARLREKTDITCLADLTPREFEQLSSALSGTILRRTRHVVYECERVRLAVEAMRAGDMDGFGALLNASHDSLRDLYEVTGRELDSLAAAARSHPGCLGSRMTGGGFGGCTVSLIRREAREDFEKFVTERYRRETGYVPSFYAADPADGITVREL